MKILHLNTSDISGGAARAAFRLHQGLLKSGIDSKMLVQSKKSDSCTVFGPTSKIAKGIAKIRPILDGIGLYRYPERNKILFSPSWLPSLNIVDEIHKINPDIVHLHWIAGGFIRIEQLAKIKKPIIWSLHDMWAFTGGCHIDGGCGKYQEHCSTCPVLGSQKENDLSRRIFNRKKKTFAKISQLTINGLSRWLADCAQSSSLFRGSNVVNLPNPIDCNTYRPLPKGQAKQILGLSPQKRHILFGAMSSTKDKNKGFFELTQALQQLKNEKVELTIFGSNKPAAPPYFPFPARYLGQLHDDISLRILYSAADVMIVPSKQENLSNAIMESLACGTPVVGFDIGGNKDMIDHQKNGYLATAYSSNDLARGIDWVLDDQERHLQLCKNARQKILSSFDEHIVIPKYITLYESILKESK